MMAKDDVVFTFLDKGTIHGIPARDLTQDDIDRLSLERQRDVRAGTIYEPATKAAETDTKRQAKAIDAAVAAAEEGE